MFDVVVAREYGARFMGMLQNLSQTPLWHDARMHHENAVFVVRQRPLSEPVEPVLAVGREQDVVQCVGASGRAHAGGDTEQVDVVVAENDARAAAERPHLAQYAEVVGASVDQIAAEPDIGVRGNLCEQSGERFGAALNVADDIKIGLGLVLTWVGLGTRTVVNVLHRFLWFWVAMMSL